MKKTIILTTLFSLLAVAASTSALAQQPRGGKSYWGIQLTQTQIDYNAGFSFDIPFANLKVGYNINDYFALEGRLGLALGDDTDRKTLNGTQTDITLSPDPMWGLYGVGHLDVSDNFSLYAVVGYTKAQTSADISDGTTTVSVSDDDDGFSAGGGVEFAITRSLSLTLEYMSYLRNKGYDASGYTIGIQSNF